jgi:hypothetical protein
MYNGTCPKEDCGETGAELWDEDFDGDFMKFTLICGTCGTKFTEIWQLVNTIIVEEK